MNESDRIEIEELKAKIESLRERVAEMESLSTASGGGWDVSGEIRRPAILNCNPSYPIKPFTMLKNPAYGYDNYRMYVPDGCVLYGGVAVPVQGKDGEDWLDIGSSAEGNTFYGHVIPDSGGNPDHVEVNTSATASGALASFKIAYLGSSDGGDVQVACGIVSIGGGEGKPYGAFQYKSAQGEEVVDGNTVRYGTVTQCRFQFSRTVYDMSSYENFHVPYGSTLYLLVPHAYPNTASLTITAPQGGNSLTQTVIRLFSTSMTTGEIATDYRAMPVLPLYGAETGTVQ